MTSVHVVVAQAADMVEFGRRLAGRLRRGDLLVLDGPLGAGKTTLTRGIGDGLGVRGDVSSPTFVIARRHRAATQGPALLHVDAYRLSADELADLELDLEVADSVSVVEWGRNKVEDWGPDRLEVGIALDPQDPHGPRTITMTGHGARWSDEALRDLAELP